MSAVLHFVLCDFKSGPAWVERYPADMTREETIKDIKNGQIEDVRKILAVDMATMVAQDVTAEILEAAADWDGLEITRFKHPVSGRLVFQVNDNEGNYGFGFDELEARADCLEQQRVA